MTHTNKHTPVIWTCDLCQKQINKKQTSIRCNHTHWFHLKCTHIQQRQYKPDWRCTFHTPTQNVTTTPSTTHTNTTPHHKQTTTHPLTNNNQPKDKKQININGIRNKIEELNRGTKKPSTQHPTGHHHNTRKQNSHRKAVSTYLNNRQHKQSHKHHTTHSTSLRNNTPSNPSYPGLTQNKQMSPTTLIFKQNRRSQTPIITTPAL